MAIKDEIKKMVDNLPDDALTVLRDYLKQLDNIPADKQRISINLGTIIKEDKELLHRLAK